MSKANKCLNKYKYRWRTLSLRRSYELSGLVFIWLDAGPAFVFIPNDSSSVL